MLKIKNLKKKIAIAFGTFAMVFTGIGLVAHASTTSAHDVSPIKYDEYILEYEKINFANEYYGNVTRHSSASSLGPSVTSTSDLTLGSEWLINANGYLEINMPTSPTYIDRVRDYYIYLGANNDSLSFQITFFQTGNNYVVNQLVNGWYHYTIDNNSTRLLIRSSQSVLGIKVYVFEAQEINALNDMFLRGVARGNGQEAQISLITLFGAIINLPINMIKSYLNFEIFGVNLFGVFTFIVSIMIVAFVIRRFKQ